MNFDNRILIQYAKKAMPGMAFYEFLPRRKRLGALAMTSLISL